MKILSAKSDIVFKKLLAENMRLLRNFIVTMLHIPDEDIVSIVVTNPELVPEIIAQKFSKLDVNVELKEKPYGRTKLINIEMQVSKTKDYKERALFYWSKLYTKNLKTGEEYKKLNECITVNILDFDMFDSEECHSEFCVLEKERYELLTKNCSIHFFELKKAENDVKLTENQKNWLRIIKADNEEEFGMLENKNDPIIKEAVDTIYKMSADEKLQELIRLRERAKDEEMSALHDAKEEGIKLGEERGKAEGKAERNFEILEILKSQGLLNDEIKKALQM